MVKLYRLLVFFVALLCVEVAANEWKLIMHPSRQAFDLEIQHKGVTLTFNCQLSIAGTALPKPTGYSARYLVPIPDTTATISERLSPDDSAAWREKLAAHSSKGQGAVALGRKITEKEAVDGAWGPMLIILVPVANFVEAWEDFESVCVDRQPSP